MAEGCENAMALWREVREQGFAGTHRQVHRFVAERRTMPTPRTAHQWRAKAGLAAAAEGKASPLLSPTTHHFSRLPREVVGRRGAEGRTGCAAGHA